MSDQKKPDEMIIIREKVHSLIKIVRDLEKAFPGRHFTLDGHLLGSIGEVLAVYYYGVDLYEASTPKHDGYVDGFYTTRHGKMKRKQSKRGGFKCCSTRLMP